jgi:hypothetical protein
VTQPVLKRITDVGEIKKIGRIKTAFKRVLKHFGKDGG